MAIGSFTIIDLRIHQSGHWSDARTLTIMTLGIFHANDILHSIAPDRSSLSSTGCTDIRLPPHRLKHTLLCLLHLPQKATTTLALQPQSSSATPTRCREPRDGESRTSFDGAPIEIPSFPRSPPKSQPWSNPAFCLWTFGIGPGVFGRGRLDLISSHPPTITSFSIYCEQFNSLYFV